MFKITFKLGKRNKRSVTSSECSVTDYIQGKNVFSIRYFYEPLSKPLEYITLNIGVFKFQIHGKKIVFMDNHKDKLKIVNNREPDFDLIHFRNSHNYIFISKYSHDYNDDSKNFIKIGMGYMMRSNVIIEIVATNKEGTF